MVKHLERIAQRQRHMLWMCSKIFIIKASAVTAAVPLRVKGKARHEYKCCLVVGLRPVRDRLRDIVRARHNGRQIIQPEKFHLVSKHLRHGYTLAVPLRLPQNGRRAHLLVVG